MPGIYGVPVTAAISAISDARWLEAQAGERKWWLGGNRTGLLRELAEVYSDALGIAASSTQGKTIIDLGGGPLPLAVLLGLPFEWLTVVDPLATLLAPDPLPNVARVAMAAEDFLGGEADEVWGYNVLQHVIDPAAVLETAKRHARVVRWFDWVGTPVAQHHPHSIAADWLLSQFAGWTLLHEQRGRVEQHRQDYVAIVAQRTEEGCLIST